MRMKTKFIKSAFTLIELMVVIAIMGILAGLLVPVVKKAMLSAKMTQTKNNGRTIYQAIMAEEITDNYLLPMSTGTNNFTTSTDYWKWLLRTDHVDVTFDVFAAEGLNPAGGLDEEKFSAENNAWCIVQDVNASMRAMTPVLFTRNLEITDINEKDLKLSENSPFGSSGLIVIRRDGSAHKLKDGDLEEMFNPAEESKTVLRP